MSLLAIQSCKQHCLQDPCSSQRTDSSARTRHSRTCSPSSYCCSPQADADLLDPLDDITLDIDLDQRSTSSATLLSRRVSSLLLSNTLFTDAANASSESDLSTPSESRQSRILYPLREPGQMTARRTQRLRSRIAAVVMSIPATCEDVGDDEPPRAINGSKLRRVSGVRDLHRAFRDGDHAPVRRASISSIGASKASYELGILASPTPPLSHLSPHSSLRTLVEVGNALHRNSGDVKKLCESTLSSISISSRFTTKLPSTFPLSRKSQTFLPTDTSQPIFSRKYHVHNLSMARSSRHTSLNLDTPLSRSPGETVWSCAKISQSSVKRAARRGHVPRRVFSNPIALYHLEGGSPAL